MKEAVKVAAAACFGEKCCGPKRGDVEVRRRREHQTTPVDVKLKGLTGAHDATSLKVEVNGDVNKAVADSFMQPSVARDA